MLPSYPTTRAKTRSEIRPGMQVLFVLKEDQKTGFLSRGCVQDILTNKPYHPRGIKVRCTNGLIGRVQDVL